MIGFLWTVQLVQIQKAQFFSQEAHLLEGGGGKSYTPLNAGVLARAAHPL
jgi:hypothetical protein